LEINPKSFKNQQANRRFSGQNWGDELGATGTDAVLKYIWNMLTYSVGEKANGEIADISRVQGI
jgi:hypothetical protein